MKSMLFATCLIASIQLLAPGSLIAQGNATSLGRGLGHAATKTLSASASQTLSASSKAASSGSKNSANAFSRGIRRLDEAAAGSNQGVHGLRNVGRAWWRGFERSAPVHSSGESVSPDTPEALDTVENFERIRQHRLDQADHLRDISERNGNESLLQTADRMEASAEKNFLRQTDAIAPPIDEEETATVSDATIVPTEKAPTGRRKGFWIRSR